MVVKRPGRPSVQRTGGFFLEVTNEDAISVGYAFLPSITHAFGNPAVLPALTKIVAEENMTVVADGKESTTVEVAKATEDMVCVATIEKILEGMLPPIRGYRLNW